MRFIDFIIYSDFLFTEEKEFQKALSGFFKSNHLLPYLEAISRDSIVKEIVRELIKNDIKAYWEILKESTAVVACIQTQDIFSEMGHYKNHLEQSYLESSGNPKLVKITNDITRVFYKYGEERLKAEYDKATKYAFDFFIKGKLISFDEYINYIFYDQDSNDSKESKFTITTLQQFISYISFVKSIVYPFSTVQDITENKTKSLDLRQLCEKLCGEIDAYYQKAAILSDKLEKVMQKIYFYIEYHFGANQEAPPGHDPECSMVITTYSGIVSSWKGLLKFEKMKMQYEKLKREYDEFLLLMTNHDGSLSRENPLIKNFFQIISYWENNIPDIHKRRTAFNALRQFQIVPSGKSDYIYRNVSEAEYISILASKRFMQSSASSSEREKWFYFFGANLGSGVQHPVKCKISLKPGASELLKSLQVEDGSRAAIVKKVETGSELNCIGIHEDGLPLFNNLVNEVEFSLNGDKKATITNKKVSFARVNVSPYCVI
ncbi:MAG: hypothetical protein JSS53_07310, partial [Proteobacteria bacterium]|nr:hypothetical protein [Pseudomonadota bacterium]